MIEWHEAIDLIRPHIVRISTPRGSGTGFLISHGTTNSVVGIATAAHVVDQAHYWEEPIRIDHVSSGESQIIRANLRAVFVDSARDTSAVLFNKGNLPLPLGSLPIAPANSFLRVGHEIGWLGFPAIAVAELCFFSGRISAWLDSLGAYLVDGVAINGVSGGPAFHVVGAGVTIMGVVSAYVPNRATGEVLPGLGMVSGVQQFHDLAPTFASLDAAKAEETPPGATAMQPRRDDEEPVSHRRSP